MATRQRSCPLIAVGEEVCDAPIKQEMESLTEDANAPDLVKKEWVVIMEPSLKTEKEFYHTQAHAVQGFTPVPQTFEYIKTELVLNDELIDNMNDSEANCKELVPLDDPMDRAGILDKVSETGELSAHSDSRKRLRKGCKKLAHHRRIYKCGFCPCSFKKKEILKRHLRIHTKDRTRDFSNSNLERHKRVHTRNGHTNQLVGAGISDKTTVTSDSNSPDRLEKGCKSLAHGERLFECKFCPSVFKTKYVFEKHLHTHAKDRKRKFACELCEKTFYSKDSLETHKVAHAKKEFRVVCEVCGSSFSRKANLKIHMLRKHLDKAQASTPASQTTDADSTSTIQILKNDPAKEATFACGVCLRSCKTKDILNKHLKTHDTNRKREFSCDLCEKKFFNKSILWSHKRIHTGTRYSCKADDERKFACDFCEKTFTKNYHLKRHMNIHTNESRFICEECGSSFTQEGTLRTHMFRKHLEKREFACDFCEKTFGKDYDLRRHRNIHTKESSFICEECGSSFTQKGSLKTHMLTKHLETREFACDFCEKTFVKHYDLKRHRNIHTNESSFICEDCGSSFRQRGHLKRHMLSMHLDKAHSITPGFQAVDDDSIKKQKCGSKFLAEAHLKWHKNSLHTKNRKPEFNCQRKEGAFECESCSRCFKTSTLLKFHRATHSNDGKQQFACDLCERTFCSNSNLKRHKNIHTNTPIFACELCGSSFTQKANLKLHVLAKHLEKGQAITPALQTPNNDDINTKPDKLLDEDTDMKSEACQVCQHIYPTEYIKIHMSVAHSKPKYNCEVCLRAFKNKYKFDRHLRSHAKVRPREIDCDFCEKTFRNNSDLKRHRNIHTNESRFVCDVCGSSFTQKGSLKTHMRRKHLDEAQSITPGPQAADDDSINKTEILKNTQAEEASFETVSCKVCGARLTGEKSLRNHMRRKHSANTPLPQKANEIPLQIKKELISDEEFLEEEFLRI